MPRLIRPPDSLRHAQRTIREPEEFGDAVSGMSLRVEFQKRQTLPSHVEQFQTMGWAFDFGEAHVKTAVRGVLPEGWASLCLVRGPAGSVWNGVPGETGTLCCIPPGEAIDGATAPGFRWMTVGLPPALWTACQALAGREHGAFNRYAAFRLSEEGFRAFEGAIETVHRALRVAEAEGLDDATSLATHLATTACELSAQAPRLRDSLRNRARLARRAAGWMREQIAEAVRIPDVCLALGVSRRELEYAFRTIFDLSPQEFLSNLRLNAVRRALLRADRATSLAEIALSHGITHLSRFANRYCALFGENPSATLRN